MTENNSTGCVATFTIDGKNIYVKEISWAGAEDVEFEPEEEGRQVCHNRYCENWADDCQKHEQES